MPYLFDDIDDSSSLQGWFVGRVTEMQDFRNSVRYVLGHESPPDNSKYYPHIFLPYGEGGMGKSALLHQFLAIAEEEGFSRERKIAIDLHHQLLSTPEALAQAIIQGVREKLPSFGHHYQEIYNRRNSLASKHQQLWDQWEDWEVLRHSSDKEINSLKNTHVSVLRHTQNQRAQLTSSYAPPHLSLQEESTRSQLSSLLAFSERKNRLPQSFDELLIDELGPEDASLFLNKYNLGDALAKDLFELAEDQPLLLSIDTYERADVHDEWLRSTVLRRPNSQMLMIIAGRNKLKEGYSKTFNRDRIRTIRFIDLNDERLNQDDIKQYLKVLLKLTDDPDDELVSEIYEISRGIPVALEALGNQLKEYGNIEPYYAMEFKRPLDRAEVVRTVTNRFLSYAIGDRSDNQEDSERKRHDRQNIKALALLLRPEDYELACTVWGIPLEKGEDLINTLARRYSFIFTGSKRQMHELVHDFVREYILSDGRHVPDWAVLSQSLQRALPFIEDRILSYTQKLSETSQISLNYYEELYEHDEWREAVLDNLNVLLWLGRDEAALRLFVNRWIEARYENRFYANELVSVALELAPKNGIWRKLRRYFKEDEEDYAPFESLSRLLEPHARAVFYYLQTRRVVVWSVTDADDLKLVNQQIDLLEKGRKIDKVWTPLQDELADAYYKRAKYYYDQQGDYQKSLDDCTRCLTLQPDHAAALTGRGAARSKLGDHQGAIQDYNRSLELLPDDPDTLFNRGLTKHNMSDYAAAIDDYTQSLLIRPDEPHILMIRGQAKFALGDLQGALEDCNRALSAGLNNSVIFSILGSIKYSQGDLQGTMADYKHGLELHPDNPDILLSLGNLKQGTGEYASALTDFDAALALRPNDPILLAVHGNAQQSLGNYVAAKADYDKSLSGLASLTDQALIYLIRSAIYANTGNYTDAMQSIEFALTLRPNDPDFFGNRAAIRYRIGDYQGALRDVEYVVTRQPGNPDARGNRAVTKYRLGNYDGALVDIEYILTIIPDHPAARALRGLVKYKLDDIRGAHEDLEYAVHTYPYFPNAAYDMACFYALQSQTDEALEWLQKAIALNPPFRIDARTDDHFNTIRSSSDFTALIYSSSA